MGKMIAELLYKLANACCIVAEAISGPYVGQMDGVNVGQRAELAQQPPPYKKPERLSWRPTADEPMDPNCVLIEIETCDDFPVNWPLPHPETRWRWACHDHAEVQYGPPLMGPDTYRGMVAHLVTSHADERWPEGMKPRS